ncbi:MAG: hypothetical protein AABW68_00225, partial [archaeon]
MKNGLSILTILVFLFVSVAYAQESISIDSPTSADVDSISVPIELDSVETVGEDAPPALEERVVSARGSLDDGSSTEDEPTIVVVDTVDVDPIPPIDFPIIPTPDPPIGPVIGELGDGILDESLGPDAAIGSPGSNGDSPPVTEGCKFVQDGIPCPDDDIPPIDPTLGGPFDGIVDLAPSPHGGGKTSTSSSSSTDSPGVSEPC